MPHAHFMPIGGKYFLMRSSVKFIVTSRWRFHRSWTRYLVCISAQLSASGTLTTVIVQSRTAWWLTSIRLRSHRLRPDAASLFETSIVVCESSRNAVGSPCGR